MAILKMLDHNVDILYKGGVSVRQLLVSGTYLR